MKPLGMDAAFRVIRPTQTEDAIWRAVEDAIDSGISPDRFRREVALAWEHYSREKLKSDLERLSP